MNTHVTTIQAHGLQPPCVPSQLLPILLLIFKMFHTFFNFSIPLLLPSFVLSKHFQYTVLISLYFQLCIFFHRGCSTGLNTQIEVSLFHVNAHLIQVKFSHSASVQLHLLPPNLWYYHIYHMYYKPNFIITLCNLMLLEEIKIRKKIIF